MVLGFSQDGACTDLLENLSVNSLKRDLSNALTFNPPLFSLVNTFKEGKLIEEQAAPDNLLEVLAAVGRKTDPGHVTQPLLDCFNRLQLVL